MKKGTAGFTLVELIVVIAILGILAGVAIPVYSGYIAKANEAADYQTLDAVKTAANFATIDKYHEARISGITVTGSTVTVTFSGVTDTTSYTLTEDDMNAYLGSSAITLEKSYTPMRPVSSPKTCLAFST